MKYKCLFLEGDMRIGKSTAILEGIKSFVPKNSVGGFMCQRLVDKGETKAFCLRSVEKVESSITEYKSGIPNIFLENISGKWVKDDKVFNTIVVELLSNLSSKKLLILDEIGGFELLSEQFRRELYQVLSSDIPILGVLKPSKNKSIMKKAIEVR